MGRFTFCRICGYQNFDDAKVCKGCGATLRGATSSEIMALLTPQPDERPLPPPPPLICPKCHQQVDSFKPAFSLKWYFVLRLLFVLPGIIYYLLTEGKSKCPKCGKVVN